MKSHRYWYARLSVVLAVVVPCLVASDRAHAGGLFLLDHGARALGRGGAFVAAPDDPSALWYNPAGLRESKNQLIVDAVLPIMLADFQRQLPDGSYADSIKARPTPVPIPTFAFSALLGKHLAIGAGVFAPNVLLMNWEKSQDRGATPAPTRYSLLGLEGSLLANVAAGVSATFGSISIGVAAHVPIGRFQAKTAVSLCDTTLCAFPEQRDFDATATATAFPVIGFTGTAGVMLDLDAVRFGFSYSLPYTLQGDTTMKIRLPSNAAFDDAEVVGNKGHFEMKMPSIIRAGGEMRPLPYLRMEGAFVWEGWSAQKSIDLDVKNIAINNVAVNGDYAVSNLSLRRDMKNVWSLRGGAELELPKKWMVVDIDVVLRGGLVYETGAFDKSTISPITLDNNKVILTGGLTVGLLDWLRFDTVAGWMFIQNIDSTIEQNKVTQPQPVNTGSNREPTVIGAGKYAFDAFYLGGGMRVLFGGTFREPKAKRASRRRRTESAAAAAAAAEEAKPDAMPILNAEPEEE
ncbi:MAG TPA: outer membrane protein transport protein [Polyangiales bacterium]|nr:outer membrane protein transport protein [Polyangiales bacterium]